MTYLGQGWKGTSTEGVVKSGDSNFGIFLQALSLLLLLERRSSMSSDDIICQYLTKRGETAAARAAPDWKSTLLGHLNVSRAR